MAQHYGYNEPTLVSDEYGEPVILNSQKTAIMQMYNIVINKRTDAYPSNSVGIGLSDYQFNGLTKATIDKISGSMNSIFVDEIPILSSVDVQISRDASMSGLVIMTVYFKVEEDTNSYGVDFRFNNSVTNGVSAFVHEVNN